jgi:hypothetical protein
MPYLCGRRAPNSRGIQAALNSAPDNLNLPVIPISFVKHGRVLVSGNYEAFYREVLFDVGADGRDHYFVNCRCVMRPVPGSIVQDKPSHEAHINPASV